MKREDIAKIFEGATDEQISAVLDINSADIGKVKGKLESERDTYKSQLETATAQLKGFEGVNVEELNGRITELNKQLADQKAAFDKQLADRDFDDLINGAVTDSKARNVKAVRALLDIDALRESKNQSADLEAALKKLREENDYDRLKSKYSIWLAQWSGSYSLACDIWQNSETGDINGINGNCDTNVILNWDIIGEETPIETESGSDIKEVQGWLNNTFNRSIAVDGIFGPLTKRAVRNFERGDYGDYVRVLQGFLICRGYDTGGFDGIFGTRTESAVRTFQTVKNLYVDGIAGRNTFEKLAT